MKMNLKIIDKLTQVPIVLIERFSAQYAVKNAAAGIDGNIYGISLPLATLNKLNIKTK